MTKERTMINPRKRVAAALAAVAVLAAAVPAAASATTPTLPGTGSQSSICFHGVLDLGPFGPLGPYGPSGPYGANGPLHGQPNPIGDAATCGGLLTYIMRGGTLDAFIHASVLPGPGH
jgi:hypothetical protein